MRIKLARNKSPPDARAIFALYRVLCGGWLGGYALRATAAGVVLLLLPTGPIHLRLVECWRFTKDL